MTKKALIVLAAVLSLALVACGGGSDPSSENAITAFSIDSVDGVIDQTGITIDITMPYGTDVSALVAEFIITGEGAYVGGTLQESGVTPNDFTDPITYTVVAEDGTEQDYLVTVSVAASSEKAITAFSLEGVAGSIDEDAKTISVAVPPGSDVTALVAEFTITGESLYVGGTMQESGVTANDFTDPVIYTVVAADSSEQDYTVTVTVVDLNLLVVTYDLTAATAMTNALASLGYPFETVSNAAFEALPVDDLLGYSAVLYAGNAGSAGNIGHLVDFLDAGGCLFISENDLGYSNNSTAFYTSYLQANYIQDDGGDLLTGVGIMAGLNPDITPDPYPDSFSVGTEGTLIFSFSDGDAAGVAVDRESYRAVYMSFDFDDIVSSDDETDVIERVVAFLVGLIQ